MIFIIKAKESREKMNKSRIFTIIITVIVCCMIFLPGCRLNNNSKSDNVDSYMNSKEELYDTSKISEAYLSGDNSRLSETDRKILEKASEILDKIIGKEMSDYDKELAVHDYLVKYTTYDKKALSVLGSPNENSDNPYGALINGEAICSGYTTSFQMFMDMLKIPCKTIYAKDEDGDEHIWNMVRLDGDWYYVDVTWDDPVPDEEGREVSHEYFNVTEEFMRENGYCWDSNGLPEANSTKYSYKAKN